MTEKPNDMPPIKETKQTQKKNKIKMKAPGCWY